MSGVVEGCTYYNVDGGLRPGESEVSYLRRRPVCLSHGGTKCAEKELAEMVERTKKVKVPEGMLKSALGAVNNKRTAHCPACDLNDIGHILEAYRRGQNAGPR